MALRTAEVDIKPFLQSLEQIAKVYSPEFLDSKLRLLAESLLQDAINAPVPIDTGALSRSGKVEPGTKPGEFIFGFSRKYASLQDLGGSKLPPKAYGSDVGPNFYFSETVRRAGPKIFERLTTLLREETAKISKGTS